MKKLYLIAILVIVFAVGGFVYSKVNDPERQARQTLEDIKNLPKEQCACWNSIEETCLPQEACQ